LVCIFILFDTDEEGNGLVLRRDEILHYLGGDYESEGLLLYVRNGIVYR